MEFFKTKSYKKFNLSTLEAISAMKVNVVFLRAKYRDYYDLCFLVKEFGIRKLFEHSTHIVEGLTLKILIVSLLYTDDIEDDNIEYLEPIEELTEEETRGFFQAQIDKNGI